MMVPIVEAVLAEIKNESIKHRLGKNASDDSQADDVRICFFCGQKKYKPRVRYGRRELLNIKYFKERLS